MPKITLNTKSPQRIKYADVITITRNGKKQTKTIDRQIDGIILKPGDTTISEQVYQKIRKSPWFVLLVQRNDIIVDGTPVEDTESKDSKKKTTKKKSGIQIGIKKQ